MSAGRTKADTPIVALVVAMAANGAIGRGGDLPWHLRSDMRYFRAITMGKPIIMGRRTFGSLPRVLDGRLNIVLTRNAHPAMWAGVTLASVTGVIALSLLELFVAFLQAYIFVFLTALFMGMALNPEH